MVMPLQFSLLVPRPTAVLRHWNAWHEHQQEQDWVLCKVTESGFVYIASVLDGAFLQPFSCQDMVAGTLVQILACFTQVLTSQE